VNRKNRPGILLIGFLSLSFTHFTHDTILLETGKNVGYLGFGAPEIGYEGNRSEFMAIASKNFNFRLEEKKRVRTAGYGRRARGLEQG
jgi:hypothetical protein